MQLDPEGVPDVRREGKQDAAVAAAEVDQAVLFPEPQPAAEDEQPQVVRRKITIGVAEPAAWACRGGAAGGYAVAPVHPPVKHAAYRHIAPVDEIAADLVPKARGQQVPCLAKRAHDDISMGRDGP